MNPHAEAQAVALERITTGIEALDGVLQGGVPRGSVVFIGGLPGTGKTILAEQMCWANARWGETVLYIGTLSEPTVKMIRFAQTFSYFDPALVDKSVVYGDVSGALKSRDPELVLAELNRLIEEHRPTLVVIDSFKATQDMFPDDFSFRVFTSALAVRLSIWEATALLVGEYNESEIRQRPEFAIADGIIYLHGTEDGLRQNRLMRLMKMRGTSFFGGDHSFEISGHGITVYPRMNPTVTDEWLVPNRRLASAIPALTEMLGGGIFEATSCLITGATGTGKTLLALSFAVAEARAGGRVLYISLEESPYQLIRDSEAFAWDLTALTESGALDIMHISPSELNIDQHATVIRERAMSLGAGLVVIDSISSFEAGVPDVAKYQSYLWAITDHFKRGGVGVIMTSESVFGDTQTARHISLFADSIISLDQIYDGSQRKRTVRIVKMRGSSHDDNKRDLILEAPEIRIGPALESEAGHSD
ncbi:MAG TPA: ATPase domain-containing protein [Dehalococcoidia bacterium]|nr:ATPase domain-containing protein [Dehalococcoidia bacterium]